jgi:pilus assembly protein FimV
MPRRQWDLIMKTKLATAVMLVMLLHASVVSALGLGDISVESKLNERFVAEVPLINSQDLGAGQIIAGLATADEFARADVERSHWLSDLSFRVRLDDSGDHVLEVTTDEALREPYLNFLLEVRWPNGRMLREYTVLLDLPFYAGGVSETSLSGSSAVGAADTQANALVQDSASKADIQRRPRVNASPAKALNTSPQKAASAVTRLPAKDDVALSRNQALSAEAAQVSAGNAEIARLQAELASSLESLDRASLENQSLVERIDDIDAKFDDIEQLLELKAQQLESLQSTLDESDTGTVPDAEITLAAELSDSRQVDTPALVPVPAEVVDPAATSVSTIGSNGFLWWIIGLAVLLACLLVWILAQRKDNYQATVFDAPQEPDIKDAYEPAEPVSAVDAAATLAAAKAVETVVAEEFYNENAERSFDGSDEADLGGQAAEPSAPETPDEVIAEADIYLAYGRNEQAVLMLEAAIESEPSHVEMRMKLLEVYGVLSDKDRFEAQKTQILLLDPEREADVAEMLEMLVGSGEDHESASQSGAIELSETVSREPVESVVYAADDIDLSNVETLSAEDLEAEVATKLDLARAYVDMGDYDGAREILNEVVDEGSELQCDEARQILDRL